MNYTVYTIKSNKTANVYFGSTTKKDLSKVFRRLVKRYENYFYGNSGYYSKCFEIICRGDAYIEVFYNYTFYSKHQLEQKLNEIIDANNDTAVNSEEYNKKRAVTGWDHINYGIQEYDEINLYHDYDDLNMYHDYDDLIMYHDYD